jgi:glyoxylase-like metal-dependent hydrolase (beta-lactamase superfamily II)
MPALILTHRHRNHIGVAARLHRETGGSVAMHVPAVDALLLGDTMTTRNVLTGVTGLKPAPFTLQPEQAVASPEPTEGIDATRVLPVHRPAWDSGVSGAVRLSAQPPRRPPVTDQCAGHRLHRRGPGARERSTGVDNTQPMTARSVHQID